MTFAQYWAVLVKQWKLVFLCLVLVGVGTFTVSKLTTPLYQSSVLIDVVVHSSSSQSDYNSLLASDQLVQTEALLATSDPVLREVASHYPNLSVEDLAKHVSSSARPNTQLLEIDVLDANPQRAAVLANDVAATLIKQQLQLTQQDNARGQQQLQQDLANTRKQIDDLTNRIASMQSQGGKQALIEVAQTELNGLQQHYNQGQTALAQLELSQAQNQDVLRVVQAAQPATKVHQPNVTLNTGIGLLAGLLLGVLLALAYSQLDTRVRTGEALGKLTSWPVLTTVWYTSSKKEDGMNSIGQNASNEAYRILRTNIGFSGIDKPLRFLLVTSGLPSEGKSTTAANLAIFMAKAGKNTLLIDADLHKPSLHALFDIPADRMGLSNAILAAGSTSKANTTQLSNGAKVQDTTLSPFLHSVSIPNLWVMPSGPLPPNPSELLDSKSMQRLLTTIANTNMEIVIFDGPPIIGLSDASIIASKVDSTLVVVDITRAKKSNFERLEAILRQTGTRVVGYVVNKQRRNRRDSDYSYYSYYRSQEQRNAESQKVKKGKPAETLPTTPVPLIQEEQKTQKVQTVRSIE